MISSDGELWLQKGWPEFADHYSLKSGYLLVFDHHGKSVFHVRIFDRSKCEIDYAPSVFQETEEPATEDDQTTAMIETEVRYAPSGCLKHLNSSSGTGADIGKKPFVRDRTNDDNDDHSLQKLTRVLRKSYRTKLGVDSWQPLNSGFCNATGISRYCSVRLRNDKGKTWKMGIVKYKSKTIGRKIVPHLMGRWLDFWKANEMKIGDIFEISHAKGNLLHVHVIKNQKSEYQIEVKGT
ncbi:hypothetical protein L2E82_44060 [Cichorium intybus]|uniref:Uncharacterized protein n=1 Tax=Cichorium intybus TaxID=13427 RepID=A0ACB8ZPJ4_CICIN|nr:hypothetical protein L2E82_44060 [Cichorium intybus]